MNAIRRSMDILSIVCLLSMPAAICGCGGDGGSHMEETNTHAGEGGHQDEAITVEMNDDEIVEAGIELIAAGPGSISQTVDLPGEIVANGDRLVGMVSRVSGIVREVKANLGDTVVKGQVLAVIESRDLADLKADFVAAVERQELARAVFEREQRLFEKKISSEQEYLDAKQAFSEAKITRRSNEQKLLSMGLSSGELAALPSYDQAQYTRYEISAPIAGTVIEKRIVSGEAVGGESELFMIADLGTVWVDIDVFEKDLGVIREGQEVVVISTDGEIAGEGIISYVGAILGTSTRTALARAVLANPAGILRPGAFVKARVELGVLDAEVAVAREAIQTIGDIKVVFVRTGAGFEARPVTVGAMDGTLLEIQSGLSAGQLYAGSGSYNIKAKHVTSGLDSHAGHGH